MIYIHIGFHKTATTSLQKDVFPYIDKKKFLGRHVATLNDNDELYFKICSYCFSANEDKELKGDIIKRLEMVQKREDIIISDEWFTADYSGFFGFEGAVWQVKIERLQHLLLNFDHKILLTLREPIEGLYSQYCEFLTVNIDAVYPSFMAYATESNDAKAYHYDQLDKFLKERFDNIFYVGFSDIKAQAGLNKLCDFFDASGLNSLGHHNKKEKNSDGTLVLVNSKVVKMCRRMFPEVIKKRVRNSIFLSNLKMKIFSAWSEERLIPFPSEADVKILEKKFSSSSLFHEKCC